MGQGVITVENSEVSSRLAFYQAPTHTAHMSLGLGCATVLSSHICHGGASAVGVPLWGEPACGEGVSRTFGSVGSSLSTGMRLTSDAQKNNHKGACWFCLWERFMSAW